MPRRPAAERRGLDLMAVMHIPGHEHQKPREVTLQEIRDLMGNCQLCPLGATRTNLVFGVGNPHARVMFIGEGPGRNEIEACAPFLREQIRSIWPDVIVCLGNFASQFVLRTNAGVTTLRGRLHQTGHFVVCPTFHPAACIYHAEWQPLLEADLTMVGEWLAAHPAGEAR